MLLRFVHLSLSNNWKRVGRGQWAGEWEVREKGSSRLHSSILFFSFSQIKGSVEGIPVPGLWRARKEARIYWVSLSVADIFFTKMLALQRANLWLVESSLQTHCSVQRIWFLFWFIFWGGGGICLKHIPVSMGVYPFCSGFSLEMPGSCLFLVCENTWGGFCHLASACPALHAMLWKPWVAASILVVPKGENEVVLTHQRLLPHPQFFQLYLRKINTLVPHTIGFLSKGLAGAAVINKVRLYKGKCL